MGEFLTPQATLWPNTFFGFGQLKAEFRQRHSIHLRAEVIAVVGKTGKGKWRCGIAGDHAIKPIHIVSPVLGAPIDADKLFC